MRQRGTEAARWRPTRLRVVLVLFFLALALPTSVLVYQAYRQLQWESLHRYRVLAEELAARIDNSMKAIIDLEETRSSGDYRYFVVEGEAQANYLQRSALSNLPDERSLPGLVSYFQVDGEGRFTTPLVPDEEINLTTLGISRDELQKRLQRSQSVHRLLSAQKLVEKKEAEPKTAQLKRDVAPAVSSELYAGNAADDQAEPLQEAEPEKDSDTAAKFDQLQQTTKHGGKVKESGQSVGRLDELALQDSFGSGKNRMVEEAASAPATKQRARRNEKAQLPQSVSVDDLRRDGLASVPVETFDTEIDPFSFATLDDQHFVLFRKVWRDNARIVQGAVIERASFVNALIETPFRATALSRVSNMLVAFRGDVLQEFVAQSGGRLSTREVDPNGALLLRASMSAPFSDLELLFTVSSLPIGPGGRILIWTAIILFVVLVGGFTLMYRLGLRQLSLHRQQQDFVSAVSHELKTPLTSIRMYGEMLRAGWVNEEKKKTYYDFIFHESERLSRLISNVLTLARMTRRETRLVLKPHTVGEVIDLIRSKISSQTEHAGFSLDFDISAGVSESVVSIDPDAAAQILINLVDNAIKFSAKSEQKRILCRVRQEKGKYVLISVRDYGPGIAPDQIKKIFALFYRPQSELTRETVGTGIGLALVKELAGAMNGTVDVSNAHPGAQFTLRLPIASRLASTKS